MNRAELEEHAGATEVELEELKKTCAEERERLSALLADESARAKGLARELEKGKQKTALAEDEKKELHTYSQSCVAPMPERIARSLVVSSSAAAACRAFPTPARVWTRVRCPRTRTLVRPRRYRCPTHCRTPPR